MFFLKAILTVIFQVALTLVLYQMQALQINNVLIQLDNLLVLILINHLSILIHSAFFKVKIANQEIYLMILALIDQIISIIILFMNQTGYTKTDGNNQKMILVNI